MCADGRHATGSGGSDHRVALDKRAFELDTDLETNVAIPVDGDMAARLDSLRSHGGPDQPTTFRHERRQFSRSGVAPNDREGNARKVLKPD